MTTKIKATKKQVSKSVQKRQAVQAAAKLDDKAVIAHLKAASPAVREAILKASEPEKQTPVFTVTELRDAGACSSGIAAFQRLFGDSAPLNAETFAKVAADPALSLGWLRQWLVNSSGRRHFEGDASLLARLTGACDNARRNIYNAAERAYYKAHAAEQKALDKAEQAAEAAYHKAEAENRKRYNVATRPISAARDKHYRAAQRAAEKACSEKATATVQARAYRELEAFLKKSWKE